MNSDQSLSPFKTVPTNSRKIIGETSYSDTEVISVTTETASFIDPETGIVPIVQCYYLLELEEEFAIFPVRSDILRTPNAVEKKTFPVPGTPEYEEILKKLREINFDTVLVIHSEKYD